MGNQLKDLADSGIERSVLQGIAQYGPEMLIDLEEFIGSKDFHWKLNREIFSVFHYLTHDKGAKNFDVPSMLAGAKGISIDRLGEDKNYTYLESIFDFAPTEENTKTLALSLWKLSLLRQAANKLEETRNSIFQMNGEEPIGQIISAVEDPILGFSASLCTQDMHESSDIGAGIDEYLEELMSDPKDIIGLSTGFPRWDKCVGGGLRRGSVNVIAARPKQGKSFMALNMARNIAEKGIPVLYLDTELTRIEDQLPRIISLMTGVDIEDIETGKFGGVPELKEAVFDLKEKIKSIPITHTWVGGYSPDAIVAEARRWLIKKVGFNDEGQANECMIIYDYLKIMNHDEIKSNMGEYQLLGFIMSKIYDFAKRWGIPLLALAQLNQDEVLASSDRIRWLCTSLTYLKPKTTEELNADPSTNGTKKFIIDVTRKGPGLPVGEYINIKDSLAEAKFVEGPKSKEALAQAFNAQLSNEKVQ